MPLTQYNSIQEITDTGKLKLESQLPKPIQAPHIKAYCHQCERITCTAFKQTKAGIGNACSVCGCFRKGKPYVSKAQFNTLKLEAAKGGNDEKNTL